MFQSVESSVTSHTFEIASGEEVVAADIGYAVGGIYASMSGFSDRNRPSLGIVQMMV